MDRNTAGATSRAIEKVTTKMLTLAWLKNCESSETSVPSDGPPQLSLIATTRWERTGVQSKADAGEIWRRFPKFVLGFLIASAVITLVSKGQTR